MDNNPLKRSADEITRAQDDSLSLQSDSSLARGGGGAAITSDFPVPDLSYLDYNTETHATVWDDMLKKYGDHKDDLSTFTSDLHKSGSPKEDLSALKDDLHYKSDLSKLGTDSDLQHFKTELSRIHSSLDDVNIIFDNELEHYGLFRERTRTIHLNKRLLELRYDEIKGIHKDVDIYDVYRYSVLHEAAHAMQEPLGITITGDAHIDHNEMYGKIQKTVFTRFAGHYFSDEKISNPLIKVSMFFDKYYEQEFPNLVLNLVNLMTPELKVAEEGFELAKFTKHLGKDVEKLSKFQHTPFPHI